MDAHWRRRGPLAPFGGFKQSGIGRQYGLFGLESFLEPGGVLI
jgi:aldehyde dehydrogenase (NAD+)